MNNTHISLRLSINLFNQISEFYTFFDCWILFKASRCEIYA